MASSSAGDNATRTPLPSFEELSRAKQTALLTKDAQRLRWALDGPLTTALSVMQEPYHDPEAGSPEPYFNSQNGSWHAVSQTPYTDPKISSVTVTVWQLDDWEYQWVELHRGHSTPPDHSGDDDDDYDDYDDFPLECCGMQRPRPQNLSLVVRATGDFLTVHDYVSAVHPWLLQKRDNILGALGVFDDQPLSLLPGKKLIVFFGPETVWVDKEEEWFKSKDKTQYLEAEKRGKYPAPQTIPAAEGEIARGRVDKGPPYNQNNIPPNYIGEWPPLLIYGWPWPPPYRGTGSSYIEPKADSPGRPRGSGSSGPPYHKNNVPPNYDGQWPPGLIYDGPWPAPWGSLFNADRSLFSPQ